MVNIFFLGGDRLENRNQDSLTKLKLAAVVLPRTVLPGNRKELCHGQQCLYRRMPTWNRRKIHMYLVILIFDDISM